MINSTYSYTGFQNLALLLLRFFTGWHILYEGVAKLLIPQWTAAEYLRNAEWILSGFAEWIVAHDTVLCVVDFLNVWGLIAIGAGIIFGLFFRVAAVSGAVLLLLYYLMTPPLAGLEYALPADGSNLIVNKTLIEAAALLILAVFPTSNRFGLDYFIKKYTKN